MIKSTLSVFFVGCLAVNTTYASELNASTPETLVSAAPVRTLASSTPDLSVMASESPEVTKAAFLDPFASAPDLNDMNAVLQVKKMVSSTKTLAATGIDVSNKTKDSNTLIQSGAASWYGNPFHGRKTASGAIFDMFKMTAAHKTLPLNSRVMVVNTSNNKSVMVTVNDRGPYVRGRVLDLSYAAAKFLGINGVGHVRIERVN